MRLIAILALVLTLAPRAAATDSCVACHQQLEKPVQVEGMKADVHAGALSCASCHGGDPSDPDLSAMDEAKGFVGRPSPVRIPALCGTCHGDETYMRRFNPNLPTDQLAQYGTSVHGQRLADGDSKVATCISCHGVHGILAPGDARSPVHPANVAKTCARCHADATYMAEYPIPTDQFVKYQRSVHGQMLLVQLDTSAPTCNDCHGNHGAFPPGAASVDAVCGQCHPVNRDFFVASPHKAAFQRQGLPECVVCHGNHEVQRTSDEMIGTGEVSVCIGCHPADSPGYEAAGQMRMVIDRLRRAIDGAQQAMMRANAAGMEVGEAEFTLQEAREALVQTRNLVHTSNPAAVDKVADAGTDTAAAVEGIALAALVELTNRRWLAIIPLAMIAIVAGLLYWKVRTLDSDPVSPTDRAESKEQR
jgi:hypothetical protein